MKKLLSFIVAVFVTLTLIGQAPESFKYQAVLRNASGNIRVSASVSIDIAIIQGSTTGTEVFIETHNTVTNEFGLVNLEIGSINTSGFAAIDWTNGPYYLKVSVDGTEMGTSQLLSVPFALHAKSAETANTYAETDPVFTASPAEVITSTNISNWHSAYLWGNHANAGYAKYPSQAGNSGKVLSTNGTSTFWTWPVTWGDLNLKVNKSGDNMTGKLSINNLSDSTALELNSNGHTELRIRSEAAYTPGIIMGTTTDGSTAEGAIIKYLDNNYGSSRKISFNFAPSTNVLNILSNGNVGIGTSDPIAKLNIVATVNEGAERSLIRLKNNSTGSKAQTGISLCSFEDNGVTLGYESSTYTMNDLDDFGFLTTNGRGLAFLAQNNGQIRFYTNQLYDNTPVEQMRIDEDGNVGIGTTSPMTKLEIADGDVYISDIEHGIILTSPDGQCWRGTINNSGVLEFTAITCP